MDVLFKGAAMVAMFAVAVVLIIGLRNMMRGGDGNFSNKYDAAARFPAVHCHCPDRRGDLLRPCEKRSVRYGQAQQDLYPHR
jgi:hypothetical protein